MEKKTICRQVSSVREAYRISQEHLERLIHEIGMEIVSTRSTSEKDGTIRLPLPAEPMRPFASQG